MCDGKAVRRARILTRYLKSEAFIDAHSDIFNKCQKYSPRQGCDWILSDSRFQAWKTSSVSNFLALTGGRGTGKFIVASHITNALLSDPCIDGLVLHFHAVLWENEPLDPKLILRCLISQLLRQRPDVLLEKRTRFYKQKYRDVATDLHQLFSFFLDVVNVIGSKIYVVLDALDSCPNRVVLARRLVKVSKCGIPLKIVVTTTDDYQLNSCFEDVIKIELTHDDVSCDISTYVGDQLNRNLGHLEHEKDGLLHTIVAGAANNVGWARYILWGLAKSTTKEEIDFYLGEASKGRDIVYGRAFDEISSRSSLRRIFIIKIILRSLISAGDGLTIENIKKEVEIIEDTGQIPETTNQPYQPSSLPNCVDGEIKDGLKALHASSIPLITDEGGILKINSESIRDYFLYHVPPQRPQIPHLWIQSDSCILSCQLKHRLHKDAFAEGSLEHVPHNFNDYALGLIVDDSERYVNRCR